MKSTFLGMSAISMTVSHLNAPYGAILTNDELAESLLTGSVMGSSPVSRAIIEQLFIEVSPSLILRCVSEVGGGACQANMLYQKSLESGAVRNLGWELFLQGL